MIKVTDTPTIVSVTRVIQGTHCDQDYVHTYHCPASVKGLYRELAVTKVTYTLTTTSVARVIRGARCDQGSIHTYHCQCYNGYTGSTL